MPSPTLLNALRLTTYSDDAPAPQSQPITRLSIYLLIPDVNIYSLWLWVYKRHCTKRVHNFAKCRTIFKILSSWDSVVKSSVKNKMQSKTADFAPGETIRQTRRNICVIFDYAIHSIMWKKWPHPQKRKYITYRTAVRGRPSHDHSNVYRKLGEIWTCGFWDMWVDRDKQTDIQTR